MRMERHHPFGVVRIRLQKGEYEAAAAHIHISVGFVVHWVAGCEE